MTAAIASCDRLPTIYRKDRLQDPHRRVFNGSSQKSYGFALARANSFHLIDRRTADGLPLQWPGVASIQGKGPIDAEVGSNAEDMDFLPIGGHGNCWR